jgi:SSS family transporter
MTPTLILIGLSSYFLILLGIGYVTGRKANNDSYFLGNKQSLWWMVALGMLSDSMSGVSFISVPGAVYKSNFYYMQVVFGYFIGYLAIAYWLLPLYYKHNLTSIYTYLEQRFGVVEQRTGSFFFIVSRLLGAAGRLFLTAIVFQKFLFEPLGVPFFITVAVIILLILAYTFKGGIKTLVFTDAIQSTFLIGGLLFTVIALLNSELLSSVGLFEILNKSTHASIINSDFYSNSFFWKHFLGGAFMCIAMTGLDQNMMQKNLSCKSLKEAQKNMISTAFIVVLVNVIFLSLGAVMIEFFTQLGSFPGETDQFFPTIALEHLGPAAGMAFVLGLSAATFSSADSVLTTLTTSTYFDLLNLDANASLSDSKKLLYRRVLHGFFAVLLLLAIMGFYKYSSGALIDVVLGLANYTYGPLLGLFALGIFTKTNTNSKAVLLVSLTVPLLCWYLGNNTFVSGFLGIDPLNLKYQFGFELLMLNGLLSFFGYYFTSKISQRF